MTPLFLVRKVTYILKRYYCSLTECSKQGSMQQKILSSINSSIVISTFSRNLGEKLKLDLIHSYL